MLIRLIANILLFMFLLPALGLVTFTGGLALPNGRTIGSGDGCASLPTPRGCFAAK